MSDVGHVRSLRRAPGHVYTCRGEGEVLRVLMRGDRGEARNIRRIEVIVWIKIKSEGEEFTKERMKIEEEEFLKKEEVF